MAFNFCGSFRFPQSYDHYLNWPLPPASEDPQLYRTRWDFFTENNFPSINTEHDLETQSQLPYRQGPGALETTCTTDVQTSHILSWDVQPVDKVPISSSLTMPNTVHGDPIELTGCPLHDGDQGVAHWNGYMSIDPTWSSWSTLSAGQPPFSVDPETGTHWHPSLQQSNIYLSPSCSSAMTPSPYSNGSFMESFMPQRAPLYQSFASTGPQTTSNMITETARRPHPSSYRRRAAANPSRVGRSARAIEYDGVWIDEEELVKSLTEPSGELDLHQCRWEENHSPCHLWIKGDKSFIHAHLQKWHGQTRGGDKMRVQCRWSGCVKTMQKESIARHIVSVHLDERWECQGCGKEIARNDAYGQHAKQSSSEACRTLDALITYSVETKVVNARAALDGGGRVRYSCAKMS